MGPSPSSKTLPLKTFLKIPGSGNLTFYYCLPGTYVPLTMEGTILVDGVLASCYASFDHHLAHIAMTPIRWFPGVMEWIFGWDNGSPSYVNIIKDFGKWIIPHGIQHKTPQLFELYQNYFSAQNKPYSYSLCLKKIMFDPVQ